MLKAIFEDACSLVSLALFGACLLVWMAVLANVTREPPSTSQIQPIPHSLRHDMHRADQPLQTRP